MAFADSSFQSDSTESMIEAECLSSEICIERRNIEDLSREPFQFASRDGMAVNQDIRNFINDIIDEEIAEELIEELDEPEYLNMEVPCAENANTGFKSFMDYRAIKNKASEQYKLQQNAVTDAGGFRIYDDCYMVALGTYYVDNIGDKFRITLEDGTVFYAIAGDTKSDLHTDSKHQHKNGNIVEFIVDTKEISATCRKMGDMSYAGFDGKIKSIEKIIE